MAELVATYSVEVVIIILLIAIPALVNFITWCKGLWQKREAFRVANINEGRVIEAEEEAAEAEIANIKQEIKTMKDNIATLTTLAEGQDKLIKLLIQSDELDIKSWIKAQHEKWVPKQCIDSQTLDLLEQRYALYVKEGGNSWAERLVQDLRALPVVTIVPVYNNHEGNI